MPAPVEVQLAVGRVASAVGFLWAAFAWFFVAIASQVAAQPFYIVIRGQGTTGLPSQIIVLSASLDPVVFAVLGVVVLAAHEFLFRSKGGLQKSELLTSAGLGAGLVGYLFWSPLFAVLVGVVGFAMMLQDGKSAKPGAGVSNPLAVFLLAFIGILASMAVLGDAGWVAGGFDGATPFSDPSRGFALAGVRILGLGYPWVPWLVLLFLFSWALRPLLSSRLRLPAWRQDETAGTPPPGPQRERFFRAWSRLTLFGGFVIAALVGAYPFLPAINPSGALVGTDLTGGYSCWLGLSPNPLMTWECNPGWYIPHIGSLWLLQGITAITGSAELTLQLYPFLGGLLFVLATYLLAKEGTGDPLLAGVSALFASVSLETSTAIDAGILANWVALSVGFLFFAAFLRALRTKSYRLLFPASSITVTILFIHPWTWFLLLGILVAYLLVELVQAALTRTLRQRKIEVTMLSIKIVLGVIAGEAKSLLTLSSGSAPILSSASAPVLTNGFAPGVSTVLGALNIGGIPQTVPYLATSMIQWLGGAEANAMWFILGTLGVVAIPSFRSRFGKLMLVWVAAIGISLVATGSSGSLLQERLLFDIPFPILAAIGFTRLVRSFTSRLPDGSLSPRKPSGIFWLLSLVAVTGLTLGFTLEYVGFLFIP